MDRKSEAKFKFSTATLGGRSCRSAAQKVILSSFRKRTSSVEKQVHAGLVIGHNILEPVEVEAIFNVRSVNLKKMATY